MPKKFSMRTNKKRTKVKGYGPKGSTGTSRGSHARRYAKRGKGYFSR